IPLMGWAAGTAAAYARGLTGLQLALVHVHVLVAVEHLAHQLVGDAAFAVFFDDAQVVGLDGIVVLAVGELAPHRRIIGLGERLDDGLAIGDLAAHLLDRRVHGHDDVIGLRGIHGRVAAVVFLAEGVD